ncbi:DUF2169 domain-containing protein [Vibrio sp. TBV020]|uniref:DUF2169 family type VI secretion system accessory protein n=1 Tax=Vibrio sp. TBV020 TaxID=3137398 RepID=UPI0038CD3209
MQQFNHTFLPSVAWENADANQEWFYTCLMRITYRLLPQGHGPSQRWTLQVSPEQGRLFAADTYQEDDPNQVLRYESDFITHKPHTDVVFNANTYAPSGQPENQWHCGVEVLSEQGERLNDLHLTVKGERDWTQGPLGWRKTSLRPVSQVRLSYGLAEGGKVLNLDPKAKESYWTIDEQNPVGTGIKHNEMPTNDFPVAQVYWRHLRDSLQGVPPGLGFIDRCWKVRYQLAGTYDEAWLEEQHPYLPEDFNDQYQQAAQPKLIAKGYLQPGCQFKLLALAPNYPELTVTLPRLYAFAELMDSTQRRHRYKLEIDTILFDIDAPDMADWRVYVSYRRRIAKKQTMTACHFHYLPTQWRQQEHSDG